MDSWFKTLKSWSQLFHRLYYSIKLFCSLYQFWQLCFSYHIVVGYFSLSCEAGINQTENNRLDKHHRLITTNFQISSHVNAASTWSSLPWNLLHYTWRALGEFSWWKHFYDGNNFPHPVVEVMIEIRWLLRIDDAEPSSYFYHKLWCCFLTIHHQQIDNRMKLHLQNSPDVVKILRCHWQQKLWWDDMPIENLIKGVEHGKYSV